MIADATAISAKYAQTMRFIDHDCRVGIFFLQGNDLRQLAEVALHRKNAINDDKFNDILGALLKEFLQLFHVVMLVLQTTREATAYAIYNASVITVVTYDNVMTIG